MGAGQQVSGQRVAAAVGLAVAWGKVAGQTVAVQIPRNLTDHGLPHLAVAQTHRFAGFLLQADKRVVGKPVFHAGQAFSQLGLQRHLESTATRQGVSGRGHVQRQCAINLHQRGLLHGEGHGGNDALTHFECIARAAGGVFGFNLPQNGLEPRQGQLHRRGHVPSHFAGVASGYFHRLGR